MFWKKVFWKYATNLMRTPMPKCDFIEITFRHGWSPLNLVHIFRIPIPTYSPSGNLASPISRVLISQHLMFCSLTSWWLAVCSLPRKCTPVKYKKRQKAGFPIVTRTTSRGTRLKDCFCYFMPLVAFRTSWKHQKKAHGLLEIFD